VTGTAGVREENALDHCVTERVRLAVTRIRKLKLSGIPPATGVQVVEEMKGNGAESIHLATGLIVGYPPCPYVTFFHDFIKTKYGLEVVYGTHPIPQKYLNMHDKLGTWDDPEWQKIIEPTLADEKTRLSYD